MKNSYRALRQCLKSHRLFSEVLLQDSARAGSLRHLSAGSHLQATAVASERLQPGTAASSCQGSWWLAPVLATGLVLAPSISSCDAPPVSGSGHGDPPKADPPADSMSAVRAAVEERWKNVDEDLHRTEASMPSFRPVQPPKQPTLTSPRPGEVRIDIPLRKGVSPLKFLTALGGSGWKVKGIAIFEGKTKIEVEKGGFSAYLLMPMSKNRAEGAAHCVQVTLIGPDALAREDILPNLESLMRAANAVVQEQQRLDGSILRFWSLSSGAEGLNDLLRSLTRLSDKDVSIFLEEIPFNLHALDKMFEALQRDMQEFMPFPKREGYKGLQGFHTLEDEFPQAVPRKEELKAPTPQAPKPEDPGPYGSVAAGQAATKLERLGCTVYPPKPKVTFQWDMLAGYAEQKAAIDDTLILALQQPEVYDDVARATREQFDSNRPRAILFEGPAGCGKTTTARIIASQATVPLIYVPLESFQSKWYGEAEKNLAEIFKQAEECGKPSGGAILFLDELDAMATSRQQRMHEATRRVLGVLLRSLDGFIKGRSVVIGATNRKQDLDHALRSRFSASIFFGLPDQHTRRAIIKKYARQLADADVSALAAATDGVSGRDLRAICEQAERIWASQIVRGTAERGSAPPFRVYMTAAEKRKQELSDPTRSNEENVRI